MSAGIVDESKLLRIKKADTIANSERACLQIDRVMSDFRRMKLERKKSVDTIRVM